MIMSMRRDQQHTRYVIGLPDGTGVDVALADDGTVTVEVRPAPGRTVDSIRSGLGVRAGLTAGTGSASFQMGDVR